MESTTRSGITRFSHAAEVAFGHQEPRIDPDSHATRVLRSVDPFKRMTFAVVLSFSASLVLGGCGLFRGHDNASLDSAPIDPLTGLEQHIAADPEQPYWQHQRALLFLEEGKSAEAEATFREVLAHSPRYAPSLSMLGRMLYAEHRHAEAIAMLEPVVTDPLLDRETRTLLQAGLALHYEAADERERAESLVAVLRETNRWEDIGSTLAYIDLRGELTPQATMAAERALAASEESSVNQNNHGIALLLTGDPGGAREAFQQALALDPDATQPLYNLAIVEKYYFLNDVAAAEYFTRYAERSNEDPDGLFEVFGVVRDAAPTMMGDAAAPSRTPVEAKQ